MNFAEMRDFDVANSPGISATLFVSGCPHGCPNCFNKNLWSYKYGGHFDDEMKERFLKMASNNLVSTISILGGEPLAQGEDMLELVRDLSKLNKPIWIWTGYTFEEIVTSDIKRYIVSYADVIVDGRFVEELKDLTLKHRGSSNQRILNAKASIQYRKPIYHEL